LCSSVMNTEIHVVFPSLPIWLAACFQRADSENVNISDGSDAGGYCPAVAPAGRRCLHPGLPDCKSPGHPRTHNVQASAGAFVLGEVGRIGSRGQAVQEEETAGTKTVAPLATGAGIGGPRPPSFGRPSLRAGSCYAENVFFSGLVHCRLWCSLHCTALHCRP
jgi:hypothetical protein